MIALETDVPGIAYSELSDDEREAVIQAHLLSEHFKQEIILAFYDGIRQKPQAAFGKRMTTWTPLD